MVPRENKNKCLCKIWGEKQRVLWYFPKCPIALVIRITITKIGISGYPVNVTSHCQLCHGLRSDRFQTTEIVPQYVYSVRYTKKSFESRKKTKKTNTTQTWLHGPKLEKRHLIYIKESWNFYFSHIPIATHELQTIRSLACIFAGKKTPSVIAVI